MFAYLSGGLPGQAITLDPDKVGYGDRKPSRPSRLWRMRLRGADVLPQGEGEESQGNSQRTDRKTQNAGL